MNLELPLFIQGYVNNNENLEKFISEDNTLMLLELIFNFVEEKHISIYNNKETIDNLLLIISFIGYEILEEGAMKYDSRNLVETTSLIELNKKILSKLIKYIKKHPTELHKFKYFNAIEKQEELIKKRALLDLQKQKNDEKEHLYGLQQKINELTHKYPNNNFSNIVIEKSENPEKKFVIQKYNDNNDNDNNDTNNNYQTIYDSITKVAEKHKDTISDIVKKDMEEILLKIEVLININT